MRDETVRLALPAAGDATERPISIAIVAMGGQGGGVLTAWIVQLAENQGWVAQSTSVPGVAQRTGATIYYIEAMPPLDGRKPILSLMPTPGDVDVVMASEFMEAGRSILRGIVTPDRATLIVAMISALCLGSALGFAGGVLFSHHAMGLERPFPPHGERFGRRGPPGEPSSRYIVPHLVRTLDLTPEQADAIRGEVESTRADFAQVRDSLHARIERHLTPAQRDR